MALAGAIGRLPGLREAVGRFKMKRWVELGGQPEFPTAISTDLKGPRGAFSTDLSSTSYEISTDLGSTSGLDPLLKRQGNVRLTDTRLSGQHHSAAAAGGMGRLWKADSLVGQWTLQPAVAADE